jgi:hypothetical protein
MTVEWITYAGTLSAGSEGLLKRRGCARLAFTVTEVQTGRSFTWSARKFLANFRFLHRLEPTSKLRMNERQQSALHKALAPRTDGAQEEEGTLSNRHYRTVTGANRITATRDLAHLVELGLLVPHGAGRGAAYRVPLERFLPGGAQDVVGIGLADNGHASEASDRDQGEE